MHAYVGRGYEWHMVSITGHFQFGKLVINRQFKVPGKFPDYTVWTTVLKVKYNEQFNQNGQLGSE